MCCGCCKFPCSLFGPEPMLVDCSSCWEVLLNWSLAIINRAARTYILLALDPGFSSGHWPPCHAIIANCTLLNTFLEPSFWEECRLINNTWPVVSMLFSFRSLPGMANFWLPLLVMAQAAERIMDRQTVCMAPVVGRHHERQIRWSCRLVAPELGWLILVAKVY